MSTTSQHPGTSTLPAVYTSEVIPGLHYNIFQRALIYGSEIRRIQPVLFSILFYLDGCGGSAPLDDLFFYCFRHSICSNTVRKTISDTSSLLFTLDIPASVHISRGVVFIDYYGND